MTRALWTLILGAVYLVGSGSFTWANLLLALFVGVACASVQLAAFRAPVRVQPLQLLGLPRLLAAIAWELARGGWLMLRVLLGRNPDARIGAVALPIEPRSPRGLAVLTWVVTATPGTTLLDVDRCRGRILFNVIDASDAERVRGDIERFYRNHQRRIFP